MPGFVVAPGQAGLFAFEAGRQPSHWGGWGWRRSGAAGLAEVAVGQGVAFDGLLQKPPEQQAATARVASVEPEEPLIEVGGHVLRADGAVQGARDPTLHQREHQVHAGQRLMRRSTRGADGGRLEGVEPTGGLWVGRPAVTDDATAGLDAGEQELLQTLGAGVLDDAQSSAPKTLGAVEFYGCGEQHLAQRTAPRYAWFRAAQEGLIDLHLAGEPVPSWAHHDPTGSGAASPRRQAGEGVERDLAE